MISRVNSMAAACALALAAAAPVALAQQEQEQERKPQSQQPQSQQPRSQQKAGGADLRDFDVVVLYRTGWSAEQMLDTDVRGPQGEEIGEVKDIIVGKNGQISKVIVEVGGFLEIGDQHIGVPWNHVMIGRDMQWVQVPLREVEDGTFSLFGRIPQGEEVRAAEASWRVNELIGDYVSLRDVPRYGIASDVIFDSSGEALAVVVDRARGMWGAPGAYAYPYAGYDPGRYAYSLPFGSSDVSSRQRFDYVQLGEQSRQARAPEQRKRRNAAAGGTQPQDRVPGSERSDSTPVKSQSFSALDRDNDGALSMMEAAADPDAKQRFKELDKDNDYELSRSEYEARKAGSSTGATGEPAQ